MLQESLEKPTMPHIFHNIFKKFEVSCTKYEETGVIMELIGLK